MRSLGKANVIRKHYIGTYYYILQPYNFFVLNTSNREERISEYLFVGHSAVSLVSVILIGIKIMLICTQFLQYSQTLAYKTYVTFPIRSNKLNTVITSTGIHEPNLGLTKSDNTPGYMLSVTKQHKKIANICFHMILDTSFLILYPAVKENNKILSIIRRDSCFILFYYSSVFAAVKILNVT